MRIGLLEDDAAIVEVFSFALEARGHTVSPHATGLSLLHAFFEGDTLRTPLPYDLLLSDISLPGEVSGLETLFILYQHVEPTALPAILVSGANATVLANAKRLLPDALILRKPIGPLALAHIVEKATVSLQATS